jgi:hypothetical protein
METGLKQNTRKFTWREVNVGVVAATLIALAVLALMVLAQFYYFRHAQREVQTQWAARQVEEAVEYACVALESIQPPGAVAAGVLQSEANRALHEVSPRTGMQSLFEYVQVSEEPGKASFKLVVNNSGTDRVSAEERMLLQNASEKRGTIFNDAQNLEETGDSCADASARFYRRMFH